MGRGTKASSAPQAGEAATGPWWRAGASRWDLGIVLAAAAVRAAHLGQLLGSPFASWIVGDGEAYDAWARAIVSGDLLSRTQGVFYQSPLYPYFMAAVYGLAGADPRAVFVAQALLGTLACLLLARAARVFFDARAGTIAGLLLALFGPATFYEGVIQKAAVDAFLVSAWLFALALLERGGGVFAGVIAGFSGALLVLNRENALPLVLLVPLWLWWRRSSERDLRARLLAAFCIGLALPLALVAFRNLAVGGEFALTTAQFGPNFYIGNNPHATGFYQPLLPGRGHPRFEREDARKLAEQALGRPATAHEVSRFWAGQALRFIAGSPVQWLLLLGKKLLLAINGVEVADVDDFYGRQEQLPALRVAFLRFPLVFAAGLAGWVASRRAWRRLLPLFAGLPVYLVSLALFFVLGRYRFPLVLLLLPFAGCALGKLFEPVALREKALLLLPALAGWLATQLPLVEKRVQASSTYISLGDFYLARAQDPQRALAFFRKAAELAPESAEAQLRLAEAAAAGGDRALAERHFAEAARLAPSWSAVYLAWGRLRFQQGDFAAAASLFAKSCQLPGAAPESFRFLGDALFKLGRAEQAVTAYQEAWQQARDPVVANNLGAALAQLRRFQEAERLLREAAALDASYAQPWVNLAKVFLATGRPAEAGAALAKARTLAPDHPELPHLEARLPGSAIPPQRAR